MANEPSQFIWYELSTTDMAQAKAFYAAVVGWDVRDAHNPGPAYWMCAMDGVDVGGMRAVTPDAAAAGMRPMWLGYLHVADVDASVAAITSAGGEVFMPPTDIAQAGRIALVTDPQHAAFYVMTPSGAGGSKAFSPGTPGHAGWNELHATDWPAALDFYAGHFGWAKSDAVDMGPMGIYQTFNAGGGPIGGMMNSPAFPRPAWLYYFNVAGIDAGKTRIEAAGGVVLSGPHQVPGGLWMVHARDPQGAMFALLGPKG